jgi:hypothetical protein
MSLEQDVAQARRAVDALEQACGPVTRHFGDTVDTRRLRVDVSRLRDDLTLLCGAAETHRHGEPFASAIYDDGYDDGIATPGRTAP